MTHKKWFIIDQTLFFMALMLISTPYSFFPNNRHVIILCARTAVALMTIDVIVSVFVIRRLKKEGKYQKDPGYNPDSGSTARTVREIILGMVGLAMVMFSLYTIGEEVSIGLKVLGEAAFIVNMVAFSYLKYKRIFQSSNDGEQDKS